MKDEPRIEARVFVVGCPRSGTTLLQSLLAAHPKIGSFPESQFFLALSAKTQRHRRVFGECPRTWLGWLGLAAAERLLRSGIAPRRVRLPASLGTSVPAGSRLSRSPMLRHQASAFVALLDAMTLECSRTVWVEKSPLHHGYVDVIERFVPGAKFVHVTRNGIDVVGSLRDAVRRYPDRAPWSSFTSLDRCLDAWLAATRTACAHAGRSNHHVVAYESLIAEPRVTLEAACDFVGVDYDPAMLRRYGEAASGLVGDEPWKQGVDGPIRLPPSKFESLLSSAEQRYVRARLAEAAGTTAVERAFHTSDRVV